MSELKDESGFESGAGIPYSEVRERVLSNPKVREEFEKMQTSDEEILKAYYEIHGAVEISGVLDIEGDVGQDELRFMIGGKYFDDIVHDDWYEFIGQRVTIQIRREDAEGN